MKNLIIIPSRLESSRLPNKPLADINGEPMIVHVFNRAREANIANVIVAAGNIEIKDVIENVGGEAILTKSDHASGSDRIYEALNLYDKDSSYDNVINLQGDLPNIKKDALTKIVSLLDSSNKDFLYHHIGIYGYKRNALEAFIGLNQSKAEIDRKLEQMRAIENDMKIALGLIDELPISVDTQEDLEAARRIMVL